MLNEEFTVSEETIVCAFRYAVGRKSYVVANIVRDISENADQLSQKTRQLIIKEIKEKWHVNALGHQQDSAQWVALLHKLEEIESEGQLV